MNKILSLLLAITFMFLSVTLLSSCNDKQPNTSQNTENSSESKSQMELCEKIEKSLSVNEIDKAVSLSSQLVNSLN